MISAVGLVVVAVPIMFGSLHAAQGGTEPQAQNAGSIAPRFDQTKQIWQPYGQDIFHSGPVRCNELPAAWADSSGIRSSGRAEGEPSWLNSEKFDVEAKVDRSVVDELQKLSPDQRGRERLRMLQSLLADRFKLTLHCETKELPVYVLVIAKNGPKLQEARSGDTYADANRGPDGRPRSPGSRGVFLVGNGQLIGRAIPIASLVQVLSQHHLHRTVLDKTGLADKYDFTLQWTPDESQSEMFKGTEGGQQRTAPAPLSESSGPSIFTAIQEQLGLKLESQTGPVEVLVIDHVEKPSQN